MMNKGQQSPLFYDLCSFFWHGSGAVHYVAVQRMWWHFPTVAEKKITKQSLFLPLKKEEINDIFSVTRQPNFPWNNVHDCTLKTYCWQMVDNVELLYDSIISGSKVFSGSHDELTLLAFSLSQACRCCQAMVLLLRVVFMVKGSTQHGKC